MSRELQVLAAGPQVTVQDLGRPGLMAEGLSRGGAADRLAIHEGAALLGQGAEAAALEMAGTGGRFRATAPLRIALTGAPMRARIGARPVAWQASHPLGPDEVLEIGAAQAGTYGYMSVAGGIATPPVLGSRAAHLVARIGAPLRPGDALLLGADPAPGQGPRRLEVADRFRGGTLRVVPGAQTALYSPETRARFEATAFRRDPRGNRQGVRLAAEGAPFAAAGQLSILSEAMLPGDIQMTGDGVPFVLLPECQTTGGFPRIGSVHPADLPAVAQAAPGADLRFRFVTLEAARAAWHGEPAIRADLDAALRPLTRDPRDIDDLLGYQLVSGVTAGDEMEEP